MAKFSESVINEIKKRLTITDVVSGYVTLTRKGDRLWGLCPFHHEKTPSFSVVEDKGFYHCFGCGKGGSMFDFVMEQEHVTFPQALEILAKRAGVQVKEETEEEKKQRSFESSLSELYNKLAQTFHYILLNLPEAKEARDYLAKRQINNETIEKFKLGFAPSDTSWLYSFLKKNSYTEEFLSKSGLFSQKNPTYPLFANRIIFPIRTWQGECVAFGGRDLSGTSRAKYINTPETSLYRKRNMLFGLYEAIGALKEKRTVYVCEGNFDVISMHQAGLQNTVAPLGTAFTSDQVKLLLRYCEKVVLLFDTDAAGQNAIAKSIILCQENGIESSVLNLVKAKDASELLEKEGAQELVKSCANPVNGFDYLVHLALKRYDIRKPKAKFMVFKEVKPFLEATSHEIERQGYVKNLSDLLDVPEDKILEDFQKGESSEDKRDPDDTIPKPREISHFTIDQDLFLMLMLVNRRDLFCEFRKALKIDQLKNDEARRIYTALEDADRLGYNTDEVILQLIEDVELRDLVRSSFTNDMFKDKDAPKHVTQSIRIVKIRNLEEKKASILKVLKLDVHDKDSVVELLSQIQDLDTQIRELKKVDEGN